MAAPPDLPKRLAALKKKLAELVKRRSPRKFLPPYSPTELADVESRLGVQLSEDHRAFLLKVSQGEEDTGYAGMMPPHQGVHCLATDDSPSAPFVFGNAETAVYLDDAAKRSPRDGPLPLQGPMHGLLPIADHGDGEYDCIVLTGEQRGQMWKWWEAGLAPLYDIKEGRAQQFGFLAWAEREIRDAVRSSPPPINAKSRDVQLSGQQLTEIPPEVFSALSAEKLDLSANQLTVLPEEIGKLQALRTLALSSNQLSSLPASIGALSKLTRLFAGNNRLTHLPEAVGCLWELARLDLFNNQLRELPATVGGLTALIELDLSNNQLSALPQEVSGMRSLRTLKIAGNPLCRLPDGLAHTSLDGIELDDVPKLDLEQAISVLAEVTSLTTLGISSAHRSLPSLEKLSQLTTLRLVGLGLFELPREVLQLSSLETLSLAYNNITSLPDKLLAMPKLKKLSLSSNPIDGGYLAALRARYPQLTIYG